MSDQMTPYEQLCRAVRDYGDAAMENFLRCRAFAGAFAAQVPEFMGCSPDCVSLVPAQGAFDPHKEYGDEAFSIDTSRPIRLEPITFGICLTVPHMEDSGSIWLRTGVRVEISGERFNVFVSHQPRVRVPLDFKGQMAPALGALHQEFLQVFSKDLSYFTDERYKDGIGFVLPRQVD